MRRRIAYSTLLIIVAALCFSCEKDKVQHYRSKIRIENYSNVNIDSLKIFSSTNRFYHNFDPVVYLGIESGSATDIIECQDLEITLLFRAFIGNDSISDYWQCPNTYIDPTYGRIPPGLYSFGINKCDTVNLDMVIGLIEYD